MTPRRPMMTGRVVNVSREGMVITPRRRTTIAVQSTPGTGEKRGSTGGAEGNHGTSADRGDRAGPPLAALPPGAAGPEGRGALAGRLRRGPGRRPGGGASIELRRVGQRHRADRAR